MPPTVLIYLATMSSAVCAVAERAERARTANAKIALRMVFSLIRWRMRVGPELIRFECSEGLVNHRAEPLFARALAGKIRFIQCPIQAEPDEIHSESRRLVSAVDGRRLDQA